ILTDLFCPRFYLQPFQAQDDGLEIRVKAVRRNRNHALRHRVGAERLIARDGVLFDDRFVVNVLRRYIHQREIVGSLVGKDVFRRDRINVLLDIAGEHLFRLHLFLVRAAVEHALEVLEREFGIYGHERAAELDRRIDDRPTAEGVLRIVMVRRQNLSEQVAEKEFAEAAAELWRTQNLLQRSDIFADVVNLSVRLLQSSERLLHAADDARGVVEPLAEALLRFLHHVGILLEAFVHVSEQLSELLMDHIRIAIEDLRHLPAELIDLLLDHQERGVVLFVIEQSSQPSEPKPSQRGECTKEDEDDQKRMQRFHGGRSATEDAGRIPGSRSACGFGLPALTSPRAEIKNIDRGCALGSIRAV